MSPIPASAAPRCSHITVPVETSAGGTSASGMSFGAVLVEVSSASKEVETVSFVREAQAAARLDDPHLVRVIDAGEDRGRLQLLRRATGIPIRGFTQGSRTFGAVKAFKAIIGDLRCAVIMPQRSHHTDTLEIISEHELRKLLDLKDGDVVELQVVLQENP